MQLYPIITDKFKLDGGACFGVVPKTIWCRESIPDENNMIEVVNRCLLIKTSEKLILIDAGIGNKQDEKYLKYFYLNSDYSLEKSFKELGFSFDDVTDLIITHLHFDHIGGALTIENNEIVPTFKNANYWISKKQWDMSFNPNIREKASILKENIEPLNNYKLLKLIEKETFIDENILLKFSYGHTEGQIITYMKNNDKTFVYTADFIPSAFHIHLPVVASYDNNPLLAISEKEAFLNEAVNNNYILIFEHDLNNECCYIQKTEKGYKMKEPLLIKNLI